MSPPSLPPPRRTAAQDLAAVLASANATDAEMLTTSGLAERATRELTSPHVAAADQR